MSGRRRLSRAGGNWNCLLYTSGRPISRTMVTTIIQNLSRDARVPEEKCNPRCLRKLYSKTMDTIQMNAAMMVQMTYDHLLE